MLKILLKALVLFLIVLSVYLIVNPQACSNMWAGRVRTDLYEDGVIEWRHPMAEPEDKLAPSPANHPVISTELFEDRTEPAAQPTQTPAQVNPSASQADIDYAIASRYVELEREYANEGRAMGKDTAREISFIVMDDFEMSPAEWESFLSRATATGLFDKVRQELPDTSAQ